MTMKDAVHTVISTVKGEIRTGIVHEENHPFLRPLIAGTVESSKINRFVNTRTNIAACARIFL